MPGPSGEYTGALLTFWGLDIPKPAKPHMIEVSLTQSDDNMPQTVRAFNYTQEDLDYGAIALAVPTAAALIDNMIDRLFFTLEIKCKRVLFMDWYSGLKARDRLHECMGGRG
ncbi:hypothetical protein [Tahibacter caeni]|uniref:hypothetical protein n=1 Tax=Tahibacter caeni TaxID=1453545 RepID=UPI0021481BAC|nr:hypothetical protein [Tahibacter caeni]